MTDSQVVPSPSPSFRLAYVPGVTPTKWVRVWGERLPLVPLSLVPVEAPEGSAVLRDGLADAGLVRLPVDRSVLSAIPLYTETTVVVVPKDHVLTAVDEVELTELADEIVLHPLDDTLGWTELPGRPAFERPATTADAIELVAAGIGVLLVPQSLARLHHRKDLTYRPVLEAPQSQLALAWPEALTTELVEEFIGIVRGRTVNSSRGMAAQSKEQQDKKKEQQARKKPGGARPQQGGKPAAKAGGRGGTQAGRGGAKKAAPAKRAKPKRRS
ncbi:LysR family substrate-binding domain-containing protein [Kitasatospora sp. NPDC096147]|uniref:LysR family substrate-binding domain-containing protein n=1 Tax=Kitasatospora sp. NPDC096147 TaxID=3364093 RepID=UPI00380CEC8F